MIHLSPAHLKQIEAEALHAYPAECCGLVVGHLGAGGTVTVTRLVASANVAQAPGNDRFEVDPQVRFDTLRELAAGDEQIVGHYHSHPDHPAEPSQTDIAMAFEPELVWLITAVTQGSPGNTQAWRLNRETSEVQSVSLSLTPEN